MPDPSVLAHELLNLAPLRLEALPKGPGIYALYDHIGVARYIGITSKCLADRIFKRHVGGDGNSHKFSTVYNAGRMFHSRKHPATCPIDGSIAKHLRRLFVREHCRAVAIPVPGASKEELLSIESAVISLVPATAISWNNCRALNASEPTKTLNNFMANLGWPRDKVDAVERQARRWETVISKENAS